MRDLVVQLALRLHKLPYEIEQLTMPEIAELLAVLARESQPHVATENVEHQLLRIFGKPQVH